MTTEAKPDRTVDTRGLACPMPVLQTRRGLNEIGSGQILEVIATDFGSESDIAALAGRLGHAVVAVRRQEDRIIFHIRKS